MWASVVRLTYLGFQHLAVAGFELVQFGADLLVVREQVVEILGLLLIFSELLVLNANALFEHR